MTYRTKSYTFLLAKLKEYYSNELCKEIHDCNIGSGILNVISHINSHILVNHHSMDKTFVHSKKKVRKRGKLVMFRHKDGSVHEHVSTGDSIRGLLHDKSFFGAIKYPVLDDSNLPKTQNGRFVYDDTDPLIVMRIPIKEIKEVDIDKVIVDPYVRKSIKATVRKRMANGMTYSEAIVGDFWMLDKNGNEKKLDKNGRKLCPIRHVRCLVKSGRRFLSFNKSLPIRKHLYNSKKVLLNINCREHKNRIYAQNGDNYLLLLYEGIINGRVVKKTKIVNYFDIALLRQERLSDGNTRIKTLKDFLDEPYYTRIEENGIVYTRTSVIKRGTRLLKWEKTPKELYEKTQKELSTCLYVVQRFNDRLHYKLHLSSGDEKKLQTCGFTSMKFLIENCDFEIDDLGVIYFKN